MILTATLKNNYSFLFKIDKNSHLFQIKPRSSLNVETVLVLLIIFNLNWCNPFSGNLKIDLIIANINLTKSVDQFKCPYNLAVN